MSRKCIPKVLHPRRALVIGTILLLVVGEGKVGSSSLALKEGEREITPSESRRGRKFECTC